MQTQRKKCTELKREAIIAASKSAFEEFGVEGTSMNKIATLAKVSKRTVYNHFESKEVLIMYLLSDIWSQAMSLVDIRYDKALPLDEQLFALLLADVDAASEPSFINLARVAFGHFLFQPDMIQAEQRRLAEYSTPLLKWLQNVSKTECFEIADVHYTYKQLHNILYGSCFWPQVLQHMPVLDEEQKHRLVSETATMFFALYTRQDEPAAQSLVTN